VRTLGIETAVIRVMLMVECVVLILAEIWFIQRALGPLMKFDIIWN
jgi:hypothetical protein